MPEQSNQPAQGGLKPLPQCKAFLLCEEIYEDKVTGQYSLQKLVGSLRFPAFPGDSEPFGMFLQLYDGIGMYELSIELHDIAENTKAAMAFNMRLDFAERLARMDIAFPVASLRVPRPGRYELAVVLDGQELVTQIFDAEVENDERERQAR